MNTRLRQILGIGALVGLLLAVAALGVAAEEGPTRSESVALGGATSARVDVEMGVGELRLVGGSLANAGTPIPADHLLRGDFTYDDDDYEPKLAYAVDGTEGRLTLEQENGNHFSWPWDHHKSVWDLYLNPEVPTDLRVDFGAGETTLALGGMTLTGLDVQTGAGDVTLDLAGDWVQSLDARVDGGAGDLTVRLPSSVGVRVEVDLGAGDLEVDGLRRDGDAYVNDAYGSSPVTLTLEIDHGAGDVELEVAD